MNEYLDKDYLSDLYKIKKLLEKAKIKLWLLLIALLFKLIMKGHYFINNEKI